MPPVQKQAVSIPLTGGIDRKTDKHQISAGNLYTADNIQYISQKQISKRYGCQAVNVPGGLQGAPFTAVGTRDGVEPVIQGGNTLNRINTATNLSTYVSAPTQGRIDSIAVSSSTGNTSIPVVPSNPSCATDGSKYICVVWEEPQLNPGGAGDFYYGIQDLATGNWLISPRAYASNVSNITFAGPRVVYNGTRGTFDIFYIQYIAGTNQNGSSIQCGSIALNNLAAYAVVNTAAKITVGTSGTSAPLWFSLDVVTGLTNSTYTNATVVSFAYILSQNNSTGSTVYNTAVATYYYDKAATNKAYVHYDSTGPIQDTYPYVPAPPYYNAPKVAMTICQGTLICAIPGIVWAVNSGGTNTYREIFNTIIPTNNGTWTVKTVTDNFIALASVGNLVYYCVTVWSSYFQTAHNAVYTYQLTSPTALGTLATSSTVDPPNNTRATSILSKPFFNSITSNLYIWVGGGGYADTVANSNAYLIELAVLGSTGTPVARCLYGECANINIGTGQGGPCEVIPSTTPSRFITYLSSATTIMSINAAKVPTTFYGNLNLVGFDFQPPRPNQLLQMPQGGLFATSAIPWQYDGQQSIEAGFSTGPDITATVGATPLTGGALTAGALYWYVVCFARRDSYGNTIRSAPSSALSITLDASHTAVQFDSLAYAAPSTYVEFYRSVSTTNTSASAPGVYYLIGSVPQGAVFTDVGTYTDTTIQYQPTVYTASGEVENDPPPPVHHMAFGEHRAYIIPSDARNQIWYSKPYYPGKQLEWSADFTVNEGANAALFAAVAVLDSNIIVFKDDSIAYFTGDGPDATGSNGSFSNFQRLSSDVGCTDPGSLAIIPGGLLFRSRRGIELLTRGLQVQYIGAPVEPLVQAITTIASAVVLPNYQQVRFVPSVPGEQTLVFDYAYNRWSTYSGMASVAANVLNGQYWWLSADGSQVFQETPGQFSDNGVPIYMTIETPEIPLAGIQGWGRAYRMAVLGDFKSSHTLVIQFAYDHKPDYVDTVTYSVGLTDDVAAVLSQLDTSGPLLTVNTDGALVATVRTGEPEQVRMSRMPRQRMQALRVKITDVPLAVYAADVANSNTTLPFGESCAISDITLEFGQKANVAKLGPTGTV